MVHDLERLAQTGSLSRGQRDLVIGTLVDEAVAPPHRAADLDDLAGAGQRCVVRDPVEALDDLRPGGAQPQDEAALDSLSSPTAVIAISVGVREYRGRMLDPICVFLVTAARNPMAETASAI